MCSSSIGIFDGNLSNASAVHWVEVGPAPSGSRRFRLPASTANGAPIPHAMRQVRVRARLLSPSAQSALAGTFEARYFFGSSPAAPDSISNPFGIQTTDGCGEYAGEPSQRAGAGPASNTGTGPVRRPTTTTTTHCVRPPTHPPVPSPPVPAIVSRPPSRCRAAGTRCSTG